MLGIDVDRVQPPEDLAALIGQRLARVLEIARPRDPGAEGLALDPIHDEAGPHPVAGLQHQQDLRPWHARAQRRGEQLRLDFESRPLSHRRAALVGRIAQRHRALATFYLRDQPIGLAARAGRQPLAGLKRLETGKTSAQKGFEGRPVDHLEMPLLRNALGGALAHEAEHVSGDPPHLDLFRPLGDPVAPVVAIDMLERLVAGIAEPAMHLHRPVGRLAAQPVRPVVAHRNLVRDRERAHRIHLPRRLVDQRAQHLALRLQLNQRKLDRLVRRQLLAERRALVGVGDRLVDAELRGAER